jgi:hypothetical protein
MKMGLFGILKKDSNKSTNEFENYKLKKSNSEENVAIFDFEQSNTIKHQHEVTKLIQARLLEYEDDKTVTPDLAYYICFEIPFNMSLNEIKEKKVFEGLDKIDRMSNLEIGVYNHIGQIEKRKDNTFVVKDATEMVKNYVNEKMNPKIQERNDAIANRIEQASNERKFRNDLAQDFKAYSLENNKEKEIRKNIIKLEEQLRYKIGEKVYNDYEGTDTLEGKILKISKLDKIGKYEEKIYLYSAFVEKFDKIDDEKKELQNIPFGLPVIFTSVKEIEDVVKRQNPEELKIVLDLFSKMPQENLNKNKFNYIGGIEENGAINRNYENCSNDIKLAIENEREKLKLALQNEREQIRI